MNVWTIIVLLYANIYYATYFFIFNITFIFYSELFIVVLEIKKAKRVYLTSKIVDLCFE